MPGITVLGHLVDDGQVLTPRLLQVKVLDRVGEGPARAGAAILVVVFGRLEMDKTAAATLPTLTARHTALIRNLHIC